MPKEWPTLTLKQIDDALETMADPEIVPTDVLVRALYEARWAITVRPQLEALVERWKLTGPYVTPTERGRLYLCIHDLTAILALAKETKE